MVELPHKIHPEYLFCSAVMVIFTWKGTQFCAVFGAMSFSEVFWMENNQFVKVHIAGLWHCISKLQEEN